MLHRRDHLDRAVTFAERVERERELARLRTGDPWPVRHATHTETRYDELVPPLLDAGQTRATADGAAEDRVVPVHREARLVGVHLRMRDERVPEQADGELPVRLRLGEMVGQRQAGA